MIFSLEGEGARRADEGERSWMGYTLIRGFAPPSPLGEKEFS